MCKQDLTVYIYLNPKSSDSESIRHSALNKGEKAYRKGLSNATLWVVVVTISQYSKGSARTEAATSPLICAISIMRNAPTESAIFAKKYQSQLLETTNADTTFIVN